MLPGWLWQYIRTINGVYWYDLFDCVSGIERMVTIVSCDCEPFPVSLVRARLWPASPSFPKYAFSCTFRLLDWAEPLLLKCHVSLKDFCRALLQLSIHGWKGKKRYKCITYITFNYSQEARNIFSAELTWYSMTAISGVTTISILWESSCIGLKKSIVKCLSYSDWRVAKKKMPVRKT